MHQCFVACTSEAFSKKWLGILAEYVMRGGYGDSCEQGRENEWNQMVLGVQGPVAMAISALSTPQFFTCFPPKKNPLCPP